MGERENSHFLTPVYINLSLTKNVGIVYFVKDISYIWEPLINILEILRFVFR